MKGMNEQETNSPSEVRGGMLLGSVENAVLSRYEYRFCSNANLLRVRLAGT